MRFSYNFPAVKGVQAGREYYSLLESSRNNLRTLGQNYTLTVGMQVVSDPTAT